MQKISIIDLILLLNNLMDHEGKSIVCKAAIAYAVKIPLIIEETCGTPPK